MLKKKIIFISLFFINFTLVSYAQIGGSKVNTNNTNSNTNSSNINEINSTNISDKINSFKNLDDINEIKKTLDKKNENNTDKNNTDENLDQKDQKKKLLDQKQTFEIDPALQIYGQSFLNNRNLNYNSNNSLVPPPNYRIGPGDEIVVNMWGGSEEQNNYVVGNDGAIFPQYLGKIYVQGLTFENLQSLLISRFSGIASPNTTIDVQLSKVRSITVNIVGEVNNPNAYTLSSMGTALNALAMAGGTTPLGSLRDIQIKRNGRIIYHLDIYDFIENGGRVNDNIFLENNDYIIVPIHKKTIQTIGDFQRPMFYQLKEYENMQKILELTGGVKATARLSKVEIERFVKESKKLITFSLDTLLNDRDQDIELLNHDKITVTKFEGSIDNVLNISGAVKYPGMYELLPGERLFDLIKRTGGLKEDAYLKRALIQRGDSLNLANTIALNLENFNENSSANILLQFNDKITIFPKSTFFETDSVQILGKVKNPGVYPIYGKMSLKDLILLAGGFEKNAEYTRIEISTIYDTSGILNYLVTKPNQIRIIDIFPNLEMDTLSQNIFLKPYDIIMIKSNPDFKLQEIVNISGSIRYPGSYSLLEKSTHISNIVNRAGGLEKLALLENAILIRSKDSIGNLYCNFKKAIHNPYSKYDILLEHGDSIFIPKNNYIVSIKGEVFNPINTLIDPDLSTLKDYINLSGGFTDNAWKKGISVQYKNGKTDRTKKFLFYKFYPSVKSGATIIVPSNLSRNSINLKNLIQNSTQKITNTLNLLMASSSSILSWLLVYKSYLNK